MATRLPTINTGSFHGEEGNSLFVPNSAEAHSLISGYGRKGVEYVGGHPDFSPFTQHDSPFGRISGIVKIAHMTSNRTNPGLEYSRRSPGEKYDPMSYMGNYEQADSALAATLGVSPKDIASFRKSAKLTWHECPDGLNMQLVHTAIHDSCRHDGGVSVMREVERIAYGDGFLSPESAELMDSFSNIDGPKNARLPEGSLGVHGQTEASPVSGGSGAAADALQADSRLPLSMSLCMQRSDRDSGSGVAADLPAVSSQSGVASSLPPVGGVAIDGIAMPASMQVYIDYKRPDSLQPPPFAKAHSSADMVNVQNKPVLSAKYSPVSALSESNTAALPGIASGSVGLGVQRGSDVPIVPGRLPPNIVIGKGGPPAAIGTLKSGIKTAGAKFGRIGRKALSNRDDMGVQSALSAVNAATAAGRASQRSFVVVRGIANGAVALSGIAKSAVKDISSGVSKGLKTTVKGFSKAGGFFKGGAAAFPKGLPDVSHLLSAGAGKSDNTALQGVGTSLRVGAQGVKTGNYFVKNVSSAVKTAVKSGIKTSKGVKNGLKTANKAVKHVSKKTAKKAAKETSKKAAKVGYKITKFVAKALGPTVIIPLLIVVVGVVVINAVIGTGAASIGAIFGGIMGTKDDDGNYTEFNVRDFINDPTWGIPVLRQGTIGEIESRSAASLDNHDIVRLMVAGSDEPVEIAAESISAELLDVSGLSNIIEPIFNAVILMDYDLEPTHSQAVDLLNDMYSQIFVITEESDTEWCGQALYNGEGDPDAVCSSCGAIYAHADCPNVKTGTHSSFVCSNCCYWYCSGPHSGSHISLCPEGCTSSHSYSHSPGSSCPSRRHSCSGYSHCGGHDVLTISVTVDGIDTLIDLYFRQQIDSLIAISPRTDEQESKLQNLISFEEICWEMINQLELGFGGGMSLEELYSLIDTEFVPGSRVGYWAVVERALVYHGRSQSEMGVNFAWCAWFVNKCYNEVGLGGVYGSSSNDNRCTIRMQYEKSLDRWVSSPYYDLAPGDVIFYRGDDSQSSGHVGIVIGRDSDSVYTIEGNTTGGKCAIRWHSLDHTRIIGYGLISSS